MISENYLPKAHPETKEAVALELMRTIMQWEEKIAEHNADYSSNPRQKILELYKECYKAIGSKPLSSLSRQTH